MAGRVEDRRKSGRRPARARRRRYPRVKLGLDGFYESDDRALMIGGCNLSLRGTFIPTPVPDQVGSRATLRLCTPRARSLLKLSGRVVWSNDDPRCGPLGMGLEFDSLRDWQLKRVAAVLIRKTGLAGLKVVQLPR